MDVSSISTGCDNQGINQEEGIKKQSEDTGGIGTEDNRTTDAFNHTVIWNIQYLLVVIHAVN